MLKPRHLVKPWSFKKKLQLLQNLVVSFLGFVYPNDKTTPNQGTDAILHHGKRGRWPQINSSEIGGGRWKTRRRPFLHSCDEWPLLLGHLFGCANIFENKVEHIHCLFKLHKKRLVMFVSRCSLGGHNRRYVEIFPLRLTDIFLIHPVNLWVSKPSESDMQQIRFSSCVSTHSVQRPLQKKTLVSFFPVESWYIYLHLP